MGAALSSPQNLQPAIGQIGQQSSPPQNFQPAIGQIGQPSSPPTIIVPHVPIPTPTNGGMNAIVLPQGYTYGFCVNTSDSAALCTFGRDENAQIVIDSHHLPNQNCSAGVVGLGQIPKKNGVFSCGNFTQ